MNVNEIKVTEIHFQYLLFSSEIKWASGKGREGREGREGS